MIKKYFTLVCISKLLKELFLILETASLTDDKSTTTYKACECNTNMNLIIIELKSRTKVYIGEN